MKKIYTLVLLFLTLIAQAIDVSLTWDAPSDANITHFKVYQKATIGTNTVTTTNVVNFPALTTTFTNVPRGVNLVYYATTVVVGDLESEPSSPVSHFIPTSIPPAVVLNKPTFQFTNNTWRNVTFTWSASPALYRTTNYTVGLAGPAGFSDMFNTTNNFHTFPLLTNGNWTITVSAQNAAGYSPLTQHSIYNLTSVKPNAPARLRFYEHVTRDED